MSPKKTDFNFEQALSALTALVERMEKGQLSLEESLKNFEQGMALAKSCEKALTEAEQKALILIQQNGKDMLQPFTPSSSPSSEDD
ncbi:MAG: exodeoxyribonuclease VII small subunit [Gammaproteobacteria bacterium]|nr:exodeoxyribonuclease VII small subunit [Gammaproteobacteria bacterium]